MADAAEKKKVILRSNDNHEFEIDESLAMESKTLTHLIDDCSADEPVTLPNVNGMCLAKIIEYWRAHKSAGEDGHKAWDEEEFAKMERDQLFDMINSVNYLDTKPLFDLLCGAVADRIKNMTVEEVRDYFGLENDFAPEELEALRKENEWAFQ